MEDTPAEDTPPELVPVRYEADQELAQEFLVELEEGESGSLEHPVGQGDVQLAVVRCVLTQPQVSEDWRRTTIFHTYC